MKTMLRTLICLGLLALPLRAQQPVRMETPTFAQTTIPTNMMIVTTNPAVLMSLHVFNTGASDLYVQIHAATTNGVLRSQLSANNRPVMPPLLVFAGLNAEWVFPAGWSTTNGLVIAASATPTTYTNSTACTNLLLGVTYYGKRN